MRRRNRAKKGGLFPALLILAIVFVMPMLLTAINSLLSASEFDRSYGSALGDKTTTYMTDTVVLKMVPDMVSGEQYKTFLLESPEMLHKFWISVGYTVCITLLQTLVAALAAYAFYRYKSKLRQIIFFAYIFLMLMPYQVTLVPNYLMSKWLGIYDTPLAILLPGIFAPFGVYLLTKYMRRVPKCYVEAAQLDGAGEWKLFRKIILPQCKSAVIAVALLIFFDNWNMVEQPLVLLENENLYPLSIFLSKINENQITVAFAAAVVYMIPCLLLFLGGERHLEEGVITGGMSE